ncbi:PREDICTED: uncharacterized protein LOC107186047 [Dufourea novaeangliae]|uniref:uncharacterized protein LOC107186047 n=1 Tax=Dufourea novaeangliae TaxID=178035 RepID=UPI0007670A41|nr:PREDICTED: uncharacterized protein LOC107186047 [Dufourea novaeangliae]
MSIIEQTDVKPKQTKSRRRVSNEDSVQAVVSNDDAKKEAAKRAARRKKEIEAENIRKMFVSSLDPLDTPLKWWETEYVKYAINYPPVKSRLEHIMGSHIVRLTDRKYMQLLASSIEKYHQEQQKIRIEERKLKPPSVISRLLETSYEVLTDCMKERKYSKLKLYI